MGDSKKSAMLSNIAALQARHAADQKTIERMTHERDIIARSLGDCCIAAGIIDDQTPLTGPQLLLVGEDLRNLIMEKKI